MRCRKQLVLTIFVLQVRMEICRKSEKRTTWVLWGGLAYMATQFGILARLTWWEYSWDIMEPVTYFITYGSAMAMYAYFVVTRQVRLEFSFSLPFKNKISGKSFPKYYFTPILCIVCKPK